MTIFDVRPEDPMQRTEEGNRWYAASHAAVQSVLRRRPSPRPAQRHRSLPQFAAVLRDFNAKLDPVVVMFLGLSDFLRAHTDAVGIVLEEARAVAAEPTDLAAVARHLGRLMPASR